MNDIVPLQELCKQEEEVAKVLRESFLPALDESFAHMLVRAVHLYHHAFSHRLCSGWQSTFVKAWALEMPQLNSLFERVTRERYVVFAKGSNESMYGDAVEMHSPFVDFSVGGTESAIRYASSITTRIPSNDSPSQPCGRDCREYGIRPYTVHLFSQKGACEQ